MCSHCYGLPLYSFHRFKKRAHFKFWAIQKAAVQFSSTDFNLLVFSWFKFGILILQFDRFKSQIKQKSDNNWPISGFWSQFPEDSTWFLISDFTQLDFSDSSKSVSGSSNLEFLISYLWFSNWFNQRFPVQNFQIPDPQILFLDGIQIPDFYFKSRLNVNLIWKNQSHFQDGPG